MKTMFTDTPRKFTVRGVTLSDWGRIELDSQEMITFVTPSGKECDFTATDWGFYLGPSANSRLRRQGFKVALVANDLGQLYVNAVETERLDDFHAYLKDQGSRVLTWLDEWLPPATAGKP